ncbi:SRPBCC family protein [Sulfurimonas crateris]|uniref:SRPBCC family protein n=1 Tax=Sulfurimonas crateris TaxID=2574727 RepID=A0A4U2Z6E1_9BACT|nr:SRPBCC family protein [Sulfurimonas crateris]
MKIFEKSSRMECDIEALFDFHLDLNNLKTITPKDTKVTLLEEMFTPKKGDILRLRSAKGFISTTWEVEIRELQRPNLLLDVALKSPFKLWKHSHIFRQLEDGVCELTDRVEYELPFGIFGALFYPVTQKELDKLFTYRHDVTRDILETKKKIAAAI